MKTFVKIVSMLLLATVAFAEVPSTDSHKIAYGDMRRAVTECREGVKVSAELLKEKTIKQAVLDDKQKRIMDLQKDIQAQGSLMKPEAKEAKIAEFQKEAAEAQQLLGTLQNEMVQKEQQMIQGIVAKMEPVISTLRKEGSYFMILSKEAILDAPAHLDLTNEIIRRYDAAYGVKKEASPAPKKKSKS